MSIEQQIEELGNQIKVLKNIKIKEKLLNTCDIVENDCIHNLKVDLDFEEMSSDVDEYSHSVNGNLTISYDYINKKQQVNVHFNVKYSSQQTYDNRYSPYIECNSTLSVNPNNINYEYENNNEVKDKDKNEDEDESWEYVINKVLDYINGKDEYWRDLMNNIKYN